MSKVRPDAWPAIEPGTLRHEIRILAPVAGLDDSGATVTYQLFLETRAAREITAARDTVTSGQDWLQLEATFTMRYRAGVVAGMRLEVVRSGEVYQILAVKNVGGRNIRLELPCLLLPQAS